MIKHNSLDCQQCINENCLIKRNSQHNLGKEYLSKKHLISCKKGTAFILEGAPVHGLYFVQQGKVKVVKTGINGREQIVRIAGDGEIIGHRGYGAGKTYHISAIAMEDTLLCNFTNEVLFAMLHDIPNLTFDFMLFYAEELNISETKVKKIAQMTVRERVIDTLLYVHRKFGQQRSLLNLQLSRKEIADYAGTTEEQAIRVISSLKKEGLIEAKGTKIGINNVELLKKEIAEHNYFIDS